MSKQTACIMGEPGGPLCVCIWGEPGATDCIDCFHSSASPTSERESAAAKMEKFLKGRCKAPTECHPSLNTFPESQCLDVESKIEHVVRACEMENRVFKLYATGKNKPRSVSRHHSRGNHVTAFCR